MPLTAAASLAFALSFSFVDTPKKRYRGQRRGKCCKCCFRANFCFAARIPAAAGAKTHCKRSVKSVWQTSIYRTALCNMLRRTVCGAPALSGRKIHLWTSDYQAKSSFLGERNSFPPSFLFLFVLDWEKNFFLRDLICGHNPGGGGAEQRGQI